MAGKCDIESFRWAPAFSLGRTTNRDSSFTGRNGSKLPLERCG
jgi:hypothetical protein